MKLTQEEIESNLGISLIDFFNLFGKDIYTIDLIKKTIYKEKVIGFIMFDELKWSILVVESRAFYNGERYFNSLNKCWFLTEKEARKNLNLWLERFKEGKKKDNE